MSEKSYKREVAALSLLFVAAMVVRLFFMDSVEKIAALVPIVTGLGSTVVVMAFAAFGLHAWIQKDKP